MLSSIGRAAIRRIGTGQSHHASYVRVGEWTSQVQRVCVALSSYDTTAVHSRVGIPFAHSLRRTYATATKTTLKPRIKKAPTAGKPAAKRKSPRGTVKKTAAKPKAKPKKKKVAAKPKIRVKKVLTEGQKAKRAEVKAKVELKALKATALLSHPKELPSTAWAVLVSEQMKEKKEQMGQNFPGVSKSIADIATGYKNLDPSSREHYNHVANQNKLANEAAFRAWVQGHTPEQIRAANIARASLKRKVGKKGSGKYSSIEDLRIPKRGRNARAVFTTERWASGDLKGITVVNAAKTLNDEWNTLSAAQKKHFENIAAAEKTRYAQEYKTVFHKDLPARQKAAAVA